MKKEELSKLLHSICNSVSEGISDEKLMTDQERIVYYTYIERDEMASGESYHNIATYQIDIWSEIPKCDAYKKLREKLRKLGIHPEFYNEFVMEDPIYKRKWHTYFSLDVIEDE